MWLFFALLTPFFWSIVHVMDSHCVEEVFEKPWMGVIVSSIASLLIFVTVPFVGPFVVWELPSIQIVAIAITAGICIQISQFFYFKALAHSEAGVVAAYWNMVPAFLPIASYILLRHVLTMEQYLGIALLILASTWMCLLDANHATRMRSFLLMIIASSLQVIAFLCEEKAFANAVFYPTFLIITSSLIVTGLLPLLFKRVRRIFRNSARKLWNHKYLFGGIEIANLFALFTTQMAVNLGVPSLVAAVETTIPAYTFALSLALHHLTSRFGSEETWHRLPSKVINVGIMALGVWLLA